MSSASLNSATTTDFIHSLPSTIGPYLRRISESGPFKHTARAVRFVRRFLTYQKPENSTYPLTLTFQAPPETANERRRARKAARYAGTASGSGSKIFSHGAPVPCPVRTQEAVAEGKKSLKPHNLATKTLVGARDRLNDTKKTRSSISKKTTKAHKGAKQKPANPFAHAPSPSPASTPIGYDSMDVDDVHPRSTSLSATHCPRPLTRSESTISYSVQTDIVVTHGKRKLQLSDSEIMASRLKRLRLSVSMTSSSSTPHLLSVTTESVQDWIKSQASVHQLIAEHLKAFFIPPSLSESSHDRRMRKLAPIVNEMASVIPSPYSKDGSQHWLVLKDEVQARLAPHLQYGPTVAQIHLSRGAKGATRKSELQQVFGCASRLRRVSPLVNEL